MQLRDYLSSKRLTAAQFAEMLSGDNRSISKFAVGKWVRGERIPRREMMVEIERVTDGNVEVGDLIRAATATAHSADKPRRKVG